jgi:hypothetical protein
MQTDTPSWGQNKMLMCDLWPKWKPTPAEGALLNERWGSLKQDKLRECIKNNRMSRNQIPDLTAIHTEYCKVSGQEYTQIAGHSEVDTTRRSASALQGPTSQELADWDTWAAKILETVTDEEIEAVRETMTYVPTTSRVLAVAVEHVRLQGGRLARRGAR